MNRIIVTGGAGFLGYHLCEKLLDLGHQVICIDNLSKGRLENINRFKNSSNYNFIKFDITLPLVFNKSLKVDQIYHLASLSSPNPFKSINIHKFPFETMQANTIGTWNLCELASKLRAKFLFASTSEVYGNPLEHPQKETYKGNVSTIDSRSVYNEAKRFGETIVSAFTRSKALDGKITRIFNTYGPRMALTDGRVVVEFVQAALTNKPIYIYGNGKQTRSFCYVDDLIDGMILVMKKGDKGEIYNLGNTEEISILDLARLIKKLTKSDSEIQLITMPPEEKGQPLRRKPNILKSRKKLGWLPSIKLEEGLKKTINFYHQVLR